MAFLSSEAKTEDNLYDQFYSTKYWNGKPYEFPAHASKCNLVWPDDCPATNLVTCKANVKILNHETFELYEERQAKGTNSLVFNSFILMQVFNMINSRKVMDEINVFEGIFRNHTFAIVFVIIVAVQIVVVETPVASFFKVSHLSGAEWGVCIALGVIALPLSYVTRVIANYRMKKYGILPED
jgi:magnesium-transporting ATPase (P-type)